MQTILILTLQLLATLLSMTKSSNSQENKTLTYLALGDSYTIGEGVNEKDRYPVQLVAALNQSGNYNFSPPQIIAKTGWTVDELEAGINSAETNLDGYDLVTLLIGVNNQYRGRPVADFQREFKAILERAIGFARGKKDHVVVLSIPDWGVTPFAVSKGVNQAEVAQKINTYNTAKKEVCNQLGVAFVEITVDYREIGSKPAMVVEDELHPSGLVYSRWTKKLLTQIQKITF